jgi:hypothetical protein
VRGRILLGVAAWLVGASAATGGSLLAVSALGQGMDSAGGQVTVETLNTALSNGAAERAQSAEPNPAALDGPGSWAGS